tara:strand:+ start:3511 stop:3684 length:174 start_codon:yes stop_codon:yes gene_type:complete
MNETNYTIDEILKAINEINQDSKSIVKQSNDNTTKKLKNDIPVNTLRIIEEAEKSKN